MGRKQNTGELWSEPDALPAKRSWKTIEWAKHEKIVHRLQVRIAKAVKTKHWGLVKRLQYLLTSSGSAKLLAVRRVTSNKGKNTPGIDNTTWETSTAKLKAAQALKRRGYKAKPLRRVYIPKSNGKKRPLGIPTMHDRAFQALWALALSPVAETQADHHSYGFRPNRAVVDAIAQCHTVLARKVNARWVLEGDIRACFDHIDHQWMLDHIPMDKRVLHQWLDAGYIDKRVFHKTKEGTPQGGIASPILANMVLDGMAKAIKQAVPPGSKVNFVRYADDFICTGKTRDILETHVIPAIRTFLDERGLQLSTEKTSITNVRKGFDFLGFHLRKFGRKLVTKPEKKKVTEFLRRLKITIRKLRYKKTFEVIQELNRQLRGWVNFYGTLGKPKVLSTIDHVVYQSIRRELKRRHPKKGAKWINRTYFKSVKGYRWTFFARETKDTWKRYHHVLPLSSEKWEGKYVKFRSKATPFDPEFTAYLSKRKAIKMGRRIRKRLTGFPTITQRQKFIPGQMELFTTGSRK